MSKPIEEVLVQQNFADAESRGRHEHGWTSSFACLAREAVKPL